MKKELRLFGSLKRKWVVRDIGKEIEKESGVEISKSHVRKMMDEPRTVIQETKTLREERRSIIKMKLPAKRDSQTQSN